MLALKLNLANLQLRYLALKDKDSITSNGLVLPISIAPSPNTELPQDISTVFSAALHGRDNVEELHFESVSPLRCRTAERDFDAAIAIYRGTLISSQDSKPYCIRTGVVCKIAYNAKHVDELRSEAQFYITHLVGCQGKQVPCFYGLFQHANENIACMFLEDVGNPVTQIAVVCNKFHPCRRALLEQLIALHGQHIMHHHLDRHLHHIVWNGDPETDPENAKPFLVDFKYSIANHTCGFNDIGKTVDDLCLEEWEPHICDILCQEIFNVCLDHLSVWIPAQWPCTDPSSAPSIYLKDTQTFLNYLISQCPPDAPVTEHLKNFAAKEVQEFWTMYKGWLEKYEGNWPIEEYNDGRFRHKKGIELK